MVPNLNQREFIQFLYQVEAAFKKEKKKIVMVLDRSGIHKGKSVEKWLNKRKEQIQKILEQVKIPFDSIFQKIFFLICFLFF